MKPFKSVCWILLISVLLITSVGTMAQTRGSQFCVQSFEDRNGNGLEDVGEPRITRSLIATLANDQNVIIDSVSIEESPTVSSGVICFQRLAVGTYTLTMTSSDYVPTSIGTFTTDLAINAVERVEFPAQLRPIAVAPTDSTPDLDLSPLEREVVLKRVVASGLGSALVIGGLAVMGAIIGFLLSRRQLDQFYDEDGQQIIYPNEATPRTTFRDSNEFEQAMKESRRFDTPMQPDNFVDAFRLKGIGEEPDEADDFSFTDDDENFPSPDDDPNAAFRPPNP